MNQEKIDLINAMMEKSEVQEKAKQCKDAAELQQLFAENGVDLTVNEVEAFLSELTESVMSKIRENQELSEDDLDSVAGGLGGVAAAIIGGFASIPVAGWIVAGAVVIGLGAFVIGGINGYYSKKK